MSQAATSAGVAARPSRDQGLSPAVSGAATHSRRAATAPRANDARRMPRDLSYDLDIAHLAAVRTCQDWMALLW